MTDTTTPPSRIQSLDFLRGLMLVIMMADHLIYFPLPSLAPYTYDWTFQTLGFVSAAEGFVLLSGIMFGMIYGRKYNQSSAQFDSLAIRRVGVIYRYHIAAYALIVVLFSWSVFAEAWPQIWESQEMIKNDPWSMLLRGAFFIHQTGLLDILPMYCVFIVLSIPAMRLLAAGRWKWLMLVSVVLWVVAQARPQLLIETYTDTHLGWFELLAWQLLFVAGMVLGYRCAQNAAFRLPISTRYVVVAVVVCLPLFLYRHQFALLQDTLPYVEWFDARNLGAVRVVNTFFLAYLIYVVVQVRPRWFCAHFFTRIGQSALLVFSYHIVVCYALTPLRPILEQLPVSSQLLIWGILIASLYVPVLLKRQRFM